MNPFKRTAAVIDKTLKDLATISYWVFVVVQIVFLGLYGFKIYTNISELIYFITYIALGTLSLFGFIFFLSTYHKRKHKGIIGTKRGVRIAKYLANALVIVVLLIEFVNRNVSDLEIIVSVISIFGFVVQIVIEIVRIIYERYAELFAIAINKDVAPFMVLADPKGTIYDRINAPLEALTKQSTEEKQPTRQELYVEKLSEQYESTRKTIKAERYQEKRASIKRNIALIGKRFFGGKKSDEDEEE